MTTEKVNNLSAALSQTLSLLADVDEEVRVAHQSGGRLMLLQYQHLRKDFMRDMYELIGQNEWAIQIVELPEAQRLVVKSSRNRDILPHEQRFAAIKYRLDHIAASVQAWKWARERGDRKEEKTYRHLKGLYLRDLNETAEKMGLSLRFAEQTTTDIEKRSIVAQK
jgi:hypothetical protein